MFTSKERSNLRSMAQKLEPVGQVGKIGVNENQVKAFDDVLELRELIKITVLNNTEDDVKEIAYELAEKIRAEVVCTIGRKVVLYRKSHKKGVEHIEF